MLEVKHITLSTNGYLLDREYVRELKAAGLDEVKLDIKAYNESIHRWYTGMSNRPVLKAARYLCETRVETVLMLGGCGRNRANRFFLAQIDPGIKYKVVKFAPGEAREKVTRRPSDEEIEHAVESASKYLRNVAGGKACVQQFASQEPREGDTKKWIGVRIWKQRQLSVYRKPVAVYKNILKTGEQALLRRLYP